MAKKNKLEKAKSPTLQQATVVVPIDHSSAPYGYDAETDMPIRPPKDDRTRHQDLLKRKQVKTARCVKHADYPAADCHKCTEEADQEQARVAAATSPRPIVKPVDPPKPNAPDTDQKHIEHARKVLGIREPPKPLVRHIPLTSTVAPWSGTNPNDKRKYEAELIARAKKKDEQRSKKGEPAKLLKPVKPAAIKYQRDVSFRKKLLLPPAQIAAWLAIPEILYWNPPIEHTECVMTIEEFEKHRANAIEVLMKRISDDNHEIEDLEARRAISGLDGRTIAAKKRFFLSDIEAAKKDIENCKRRKPPKNAGERILTKEFSGTRLDPELVEIYLKNWQNFAFDSDGDLDFENLVIIQACKLGLIPKDVIAQHPELQIPEPTTPEQDMSADKEEERYAEADSRASGLSVHGRGLATTGNVWVNRGLKSFDGVYRIRQTGNDEDWSVASQTDAPDYDPSDDSD